MSTFIKSIQQQVERIWRKHMNLDELTQPGWEDAARYFCKRDKQYGTSEISVPAAVQLQTDDDAVAPALTIFGEIMECLDIVPGILQMPQVTSRPGSSHKKPGCGKPQSSMSKPGPTLPQSQIHH
jgi:hypothetical protein